MFWHTHCIYNCSISFDVVFIAHCDENFFIQTDFKQKLAVKSKASKSFSKRIVFIITALFLMLY